MTALYLYGLLPPGTAVPAAVLAGLEGVTGPVRTLDGPAAVYLVSDHDGGEILPARRSLVRHTKVLEAAMDAGPLLPARFGLVAESEAAALEMFAGGGSALADAFTRLSGRVEIGVRISGDRDAALAAVLAEDAALSRDRDQLAAGGRTSHFQRIAMGRRLGEGLARRRAEAEATLIDALLPEAVDHVLRPAETDLELLRCEFLVDRAKLDTFETALEAAMEAQAFHPGTPLAAKLVGPAPAYNFVDVPVGS